MLVVSQGYHAVAQIAGWQHVELLAQAAARAAVIGDGDDGGQVTDETGLVDAIIFVVAGRRVRGNMTAQAAQEGRETGAAAHGDDF